MQANLSLKDWFTFFEAHLKKVIIPPVHTGSEEIPSKEMGQNPQSSICAEKCVFQSLAKDNMKLQETELDKFSSCLP